MSKKKKLAPKKNSSIIIGLTIIAIILFMVLYNLPQTKKNGSSVLKQSSIKFQKDGELTFQTIDGSYISTIDIEIAENDDKRGKGLMDRLSMDETQGMLFLFPYDTIQSFWMKNTVISLDIIFVNRDKVIVTIHKETVPFDTGQYPSSKPASKVVEVIAGYTDLYGIKVGDKIVWRKN